MSNDASSYMRKSGVILAEVTNIKDPDNLNRLKCKPVTADKDVGETDCCFCMAPMGGQGYGQFFFPKVGDLVLLTYLGGDVHHPIVLGSYWANDIKAPYSIKDGVNEIRCIKTPAGIEIKLEDTEKKEKLTLTTPSGAMLQLDDENKSLALQDKNGENKLTILWEKGEITLAAKTKLTLSAGETSLVLESAGNITGKGNKTISFTGTDVEHKANSGFTANGSQVEIKSNGLLNVQASGNTTIKGALVQIN